MKWLAKTAYVRQIGGRRAQRFALRDGDPISEQLRLLFRVERQRYEACLSQLRSVLGELTEIEVAWIDDSPSEVGKPLHIGAISDARSLTYLGDQIRQRIMSVEAEFDITIEIHLFSSADAPEVSWESVTLLAGYPIVDTRSPGGSATHAGRVERSERMSEAVAELLDRDSSLKRRAERHLDALLDRDEGTASHDLEEWRGIHRHYSLQRLKEFLVSDTPRAQRLRQSSPFFAVLTAEQRDEVLQRIEKGE